MKTSFLCFVVLGCVLALASAAGRRGRNRNRESDEGCSEWVMADCVPRTGDCGRGTQKGTRTGETCALKEKSFRCRKPCGSQTGDAGSSPAAGPPAGCKYNKRGAARGDCDPSTNTRTITLTLKKGGSECPQTKEVTKPCRQDRASRSPRAGRTGRGRNTGCRYMRAEWSECDATTNTMTRTMSLKKGDPDTCEPTKTVTKRCKKEKCTFGQWSGFGDCQNGVRTKTRQVLTGGDGCQSRSSKTKPCRD